MRGFGVWRVGYGGIGFFLGFYWVVVFCRFSEGRVMFSIFFVLSFVVCFGFRV